MTIEANPGTVTPEWMETAASLGVNRVSFGMQAHQTSLLAVLGRIHTPDQVSHSVRLARAAGIDNISLDLIFGIPGQTRFQWRESLETALSMHPRHLSIYGLIPDEGTPLYEDLKLHRLILPDPEDERRMYDDALTLLVRNGMDQYEISNFALNGFECLHNIGYWTQVPYLGLGVSAASMTGMRRAGDGITYTRSTNADSLELYQYMTENGLSAASEQITPEDARFETLMLGLRMNRGVNEQFFEQMHGISLASYRGKRLCFLQEKGLLIHENGCWRMTRRGFDIQNSILVELMEN